MAPDARCRVRLRFIPEPYRRSKHPIAMSTLTAICTEERALQEEYKTALQAWTLARSADPFNVASREIVAATRTLDAVELKLKNHRSAHGC